jgi:hypothetical protein
MSPRSGRPASADPRPAGRAKAASPRSVSRFDFLAIDKISKALVFLAFLTSEIKEIKTIKRHIYPPLNLQFAI